MGLPRQTMYFNYSFTGLYKHKIAKNQSRKKLLTQLSGECISGCPEQERQPIRVSDTLMWRAEHAAASTHKPRMDDQRTFNPSCSRTVIEVEHALVSAFVCFCVLTV